LIFTKISSKIKEMKLHIPNSAFLGNINTFLSRLDLSDNGILDITINKSWISIHPLVISMIAALGKQFRPESIKCEKVLARSGHYLVRMGLFNFLGIKSEAPVIEEHEPSGRIIPLTLIKNSSDLKDFLDNLVPLLHLQNESKNVQAIQHIFSELIRNVLEHSQSGQGAIVCAQYFKKSNKISIGVADIGIGLKKSLSQSYSVQDDREAIKLALTPGVTGTTKKPGGSPQNAGFGLFLIKSIAHVNSDFFVIISGNKMYKLLQRGKANLELKGNPFDDRHSIMDIETWKGTAVGVDISINQTQEFNNLLRAIHKFYSHEVKGQKKEHYKKPKFIS